MSKITQGRIFPEYYEINMILECSYRALLPVPADSDPHGFSCYRPLQYILKLDAHVACSSFFESFSGNIEAVVWGIKWTIKSLLITYYEGAFTLDVCSVFIQVTLLMGYFIQSFMVTPRKTQERISLVSHLIPIVTVTRSVFLLHVNPPVYLREFYSYRSCIK